MLANDKCPGTRRFGDSLNGLQKTASTNSLVQDSLDVNVFATPIPPPPTPQIMRCWRNPAYKSLALTQSKCLSLEGNS